MTKPTSAKPDLDAVVCTFGKPILGAMTISLRVKIHRELVSPTKAEQLIHAQCRVRVVADPACAADAEGQQVAFATTTAEIHGAIAEIAGVSGTQKYRSFTLSMNPDAVPKDVSLRDFSEKPGRITLTKVGERLEHRGRPSTRSDDEGGDEGE